MDTEPDGAAKERFERLVAHETTMTGVTRGTMMGYPCLRVDGAFYACMHRTQGSLIVKVPAERVLDLIASGRAEPFAPNGSPFKQWATITGTPSDEDALALLEEAREFVVASAQ